MTHRRVAQPVLACELLAALVLPRVGAGGQAQPPHDAPAALVGALAHAPIPALRAAALALALAGGGPCCLLPRVGARLARLARRACGVGAVGVSGEACEGVAWQLVRQLYSRGTGI